MAAQADESRHHTKLHEGTGGHPMSTQDKLQREILPILDIPHVGLTTYDAKDPDTKYPPIEPLRPPKGAPNVLIILLDDVGFGASSAFGGPVHTPTAERLAANGLRHNRFHTTALCAPTPQHSDGNEPNITTPAAQAIRTPRSTIPIGFRTSTTTTMESPLTTRMGIRRMTFRAWAADSALGNC
jgi:hypothetical protein